MKMCAGSFFSFFAFSMLAFASWDLHTMQYTASANDGLAASQPLRGKFWPRASSRRIAKKCLSPQETRRGLFLNTKNGPYFHISIYLEHRRLAFLHWGGYVVLLVSNFQNFPFFPSSEPQRIGRTCTHTVFFRETPLLLAKTCPENFGSVKIQKFPKIHLFIGSCQTNHGLVLGIFADF